MQAFFEWPEWESVAHVGLVLLYVYIGYLFVTDKTMRRGQNILLLAILVAIDILVHQNVNYRNRTAPNYTL